MAIIKKSSGSKVHYVTCVVAFQPNGVQMTFNPPDNGGEGPSQTLTLAQYNTFVEQARNLGAAVGAGGIPDGTLAPHTQNVSKKIKTKFAFRLTGGTTWQFVNGGVVGGTPASRRRFSKPKVAPNGKLVEVTFTPLGKVQNYSYDLWLQARVLTPGKPAAKRASVIVIVDPVVRPGTLP